jgi:hypothetical protein
MRDTREPAHFQRNVNKQAKKFCQVNSKKSFATISEAMHRRSD